MTTKLIVYNLALTEIGERRLATTTENREPLRVLDDLYATVTSYCLAQGMWDFAMRSATPVQVAGAFGFAHGYTKPADLLHISAIADNVGFNPQTDRDFFDLGATVYANAAAIYMRYTSNDATAGGMLLTAWPDSFTSYVAATLARRACLRITGHGDLMQFLVANEDQLYLTAFAMHSVHLLQGMLPFNASAYNPTGNDPIPDQHLIPFAAHRGALSRLGARAPAAQGG